LTDGYFCGRLINPSGCVALPAQDVTSTLTVSATNFSGSITLFAFVSSIDYPGYVSHSVAFVAVDVSACITSFAYDVCSVIIIFTGTPFTTRTYDLGGGNRALHGKKGAPLFLQFSATFACKPFEWVPTTASGSLLFLDLLVVLQ
jgi:hypothetical protein